MSLIPTYRRRPTPLHAARAGIGICYCAAFLAVGVLYSNPLVLGGALAGLVLAATFAGASAELRSGARLARAPLRVTRQNARSVVVLSEEEYESIMETLHLLRSPANAQRLLRAIESADAGKLSEHEIAGESAAAK